MGVVDVIPRTEEEDGRCRKERSCWDVCVDARLSAVAAAAAERLD